MRGVSSMQPHAAAAQRVERRVDVGDRVGDVVQARAAPGQEAPRPACPGRSGASSSTWLVADVEQHRLDALLGHRLAVDDAASRSVCS